jgi:serine/threonine protein kinase
MSIVSEYDLNRELGSGATATVWRAIHRKSKKVYALKVSRHPKTPGVPSQIKEEGKLHSSVTHPGIVRAYHYNDQFIAMEPMEINLCEYLERSAKLHPVKSLKLFAKILEAVAFLHENNIVHRDIKADNIMLDDYNGSPKLTDFGFALKIRKGDILRKMAGTPDYLAPEIAAGTGYDGKSSDMWSMGILLFVMSQGYFPFSSAMDKTNWVLDRVARFNDDLGYPDDMSPEIRELLMRILVKDPNRRVSAKELLQDPVLLPYVTSTSKWKHIAHKIVNAFTK